MVECVPPSLRSGGTTSADALPCRVSPLITFNHHGTPFYHSEIIYFSVFFTFKMSSMLRSLRKKCKLSNVISGDMALGLALGKLLHYEPIQSLFLANFLEWTILPKPTVFKIYTSVIQIWKNIVILRCEWLLIDYLHAHGRNVLCVLSKIMCGCNRLCLTS